MQFERSRRFFWIFTYIISGIALLFLLIFIYLMVTQPNIIPDNETYGSFWLKNFSLFIAFLAFASSTLAAAYNALEQRHLRYMENYPYLEIFPILTVDSLPTPVPRQELAPQLSSLNEDYLNTVSPAHSLVGSDIEFRYFALVLRNVGHGYMTKARIAGTVEVYGDRFPVREFIVERRFNLPPDHTSLFTLFPIYGLPGYKVILTEVEYNGYFVKLSEYEGKRDFIDKHPFSIPPERRDIIFFDDFENVPAGQGWVLDFWGLWSPTNYNYVPPPSSNDHFMILSGDSRLFEEIPHYKNQGGAYKDLIDIFAYGQTAKVTARVRSLPETTAKIQLWCHDLSPTPKSRQTDAITPDQSWQEISMLYTSTQSRNLRIHLLYTPGDGQIQVDRVTVEGLYT